VFSRKIAMQYDEAAVIFTDVVGFTMSSARMEPQDVVRDLHSLVAHIDILCLAHNVQKVKTIGDAYMAWCPRPATDTTGYEHCKRVLEVARSLPDNPAMQLGGRTHAVRVGCHSGRVVAGLIGITKWAWDLWGDAVNTASRMESTGVPNRVQVSEAFAANVRHFAQLDPPRGVKVKGKGRMTTHLLSKSEHAWCYKQGQVQKPQQQRQRSLGKDKEASGAGKQEVSNTNVSEILNQRSADASPKQGLPGEANLPECES